MSSYELWVTLIPVFGFVLLSDNIYSASMTTNTYGVMKHEIMFDNSNISETEIDKLADGLIETTFFDNAVTKYVYLEKAESTYELLISVIEGIANDKQAIQPFIDLRTDLQSMFPNNKIIFKLVVNNLDNVVKNKIEIEGCL